MQIFLEKSNKLGFLINIRDYKNDQTFQYRFK